jgi:hypothetical protein
VVHPDYSLLVTVQPDELLLATLHFDGAFQQDLPEILDLQTQVSILVGKLIGSYPHSCRVHLCAVQKLSVLVLHQRELFLIGLDSADQPLILPEEISILLLEFSTKPSNYKLRLILSLAELKLQAVTIHRKVVAVVVQPLHIGQQHLLLVEQLVEFVFVVLSESNYSLLLFVQVASQGCVSSVLLANDFIKTTAFAFEGFGQFLQLQVLCSHLGCPFILHLVQLGFMKSPQSINFLTLVVEGGLKLLAETGTLLFELPVQAGDLVVGSVLVDASQLFCLIQFFLSVSKILGCKFKVLCQFLIGLTTMSELILKLFQLS